MLRRKRKLIALMSLCFLLTGYTFGMSVLAANDQAAAQETSGQEEDTKEQSDEKNVESKKEDSAQNSDVKNKETDSEPDGQDNSNDETKPDGQDNSNDETKPGGQENSDNETKPDGQENSDNETKPDDKDNSDGETEQDDEKLQDDKEDEVNSEKDSEDSKESESKEENSQTEDENQDNAESKTESDDSSSESSEPSDRIEDNVNLSGGTGNVSNWGVSYGNNGYYVYMELSDQYNGGQFSVSYADDSQSEKNGLIFNLNNGTCCNAWWAPIDGASATTEVIDGKRYAKMYIPADYFGDGEFTISCGSSWSSNSVDRTADAETEESEEKNLPEAADDPSASYTGITVDGDFSDWDSVSKTEVGAGVDRSTMVYDGDMLHFYFEFTGNPNSVTWAGPHSNGKFAVVNEHGNQMIFQLTQDENGRVMGVEGATFAANATQWMGDDYIYKWEICIPASNLPDFGLQGHNESLSFGYYLGDTMFVSDVSNSEGGSTSGGASDDPSGFIPGQGSISYDGNYDDWKDFAMTTIQYETSGTGNFAVDARGALFVDENLYGFVDTTINAHVQSGGGDMTSGMLVKVNGSDNYVFRPQFVAVDDSGNIIYDPQNQNLPMGTYEFYLIDASGWKTAENIADWDREGDIRKGTNAVYGKATLTVGASENRMEYYIEVEKLAERFGMQADELKTFSAKYERLGNEWVNCAGASSGPVVGIMLCIFSTGAVLLYQRRRGIMA